MKDKLFFGKDVEQLERQTVYDGFFQVDKIRLRHRLFAGGWSEDIHRELFVRSPAVAAILYDPKHQLVGLVEQFRIGVLDDALDVQNAQVSPWCMEVVAGMSEPNETKEEVILRELEEEAGIVPDRLQMICDYYTSPGGTNECLTLYCAVADLSEAGGLYGLADEGEDIRLVVMSENEVFKDLYGRYYNNAATLICLQWLQIHRDQLLLDDTSTSRVE